MSDLSTPPPEVVTGPTRRSPTTGAIAAALAKAQGVMRSARKDSVNPHFKSSYADLASVLDACRDSLSANQIAVLQSPSTERDGVRITTTLLHSSGEWVESDLLVPLAQRTAQQLGSAITYGRRYALSAMAGVAADEDDDGHVASQGAPAGRRTTEVSARTSARPDTLKEKVRAKLKITDVQPGETEAEAVARENEPPPPSYADAPSDTVSRLEESIRVMERMKELQQRYALSGQKMASLMKSATGKGNRNELTMMDAEKVGAAIEEWISSEPSAQQ